MRALAPLAAALVAAGCSSATHVATTSVRQADRSTAVPAAGSDRAGPRDGARRARSTVPRPHIVRDPIPFGPKRKAEMVAYARLHYGSFMRPTWRLIDPEVIVIHYSVTSTWQSVFNTFAPDVPDPELHELPGTCAHFVVDQYGVIHQLVSVGTMCRHTVGLNWTAIGIEHVGFSDAQVLGNSREMSASLRLVRWLRCRFGIAIKNVIGHNESLASPFHHEDVPSLRTQTHSDWNHADMQIYRRRLRALGPCGGTVRLQWLRRDWQT